MSRPEGPSFWQHPPQRTNCWTCRRSDRHVPDCPTCHGAGWIMFGHPRWGRVIPAALAAALLGGLAAGVVTYASHSHGAERDDRAELQAIADQVAHLPPAPPLPEDSYGAPYRNRRGRDCLYRMERVLDLARAHGWMASGQLVTWGVHCHAIALVRVGQVQWAVDGQNAYVTPLRGDRAGPFLVRGCPWSVLQTEGWAG